MSIKKLVVEEFVVTGAEEEIAVGGKYSYFKDPETGKLYRPKDGFVVEGEDISDRFIEVEE